MLIGIAAMFAEVGLLSGSSPTQAQTKIASNAVNSAAGATAFLTLSQALTGHADLNPETAVRISAAMRDTYPDFSAHADKLIGLVQTGQPASSLLAATSGDPALRDTALAIVAAWYTGTIGKGQKAIVVSYADALMYQPVRDALPVPTYCSFGRCGGPGNRHHLTQIPHLLHQPPEP
ncbi:membrane bound FAD containing D-sorbitol dehydrogenase family protein [Collimonas arenae]|uniref:sugar dehydrogenase complex small subunit n=1 Tax=Collimonas arenae TaxID=279058 RepID=UPI00077829C4|nr:sugar dehydrogenase complex small subunit [Collimonas arenae]AMO98199.1 membrane bound FAD containing D-sorbitol dehydrogenase family protein [Collimonas arenae]